MQESYICRAISRRRHQCFTNIGVCMNNAFVKETERMACQIMFTDGTNKEKNVSDPAESV